MGHVRFRSVAAAVVAVSVCALTACGGDADAGDEPPAAESDDTADATTADATTADAEPAGPPGPCDVLEPADAEAAYGVEVAESDGGTTIGGHNDIGWTVPTCAWNAGDEFELEVGLVDAEAFESGEVSCPDLSSIRGEVEAVDVAGAQSAQWQLGEALGATPATQGQLRVCLPDLMVEMKVEYTEDGPYAGDPRDATVELADTVLATVSD